MMKISKIFAGAGEYGTVVTEVTFAVLMGLGALLSYLPRNTPASKRQRRRWVSSLRKNVVLPIREDTRAELVERGYTLEEIKEAEGNAVGRLMDAVRAMVTDRDDRHLQGPEDAEFIDASRDNGQPQVSPT